jgi:outer membrane biosynthesis protein TonB
MTKKPSAFICVHLRLIIFSLSALTLAASEHHGQVKFDGLPIPGATVTASQGDKKFAAITDPDGKYSFPDLADGNWTIQVEMLCFATVTREVSVAPAAPAQEFDLKLLPMDQIKASEPPPEKPAPPAPIPTTAKKKGPPPPPPTNTPNGFQRTDVNATAPPATQPSETTTPATDEFSNQSAEELNKRAADGFLINGTVNNGASSPFALGPAFGNNRRGPRSLYNGNIGLIENNSAFDARSYSLTGQDTPKPAFNLLTGVVSFGGPMRIPKLFTNGPNFTVNYQWTRNRVANTVPGLMPILAERGGDLSALRGQILDPLNGSPFAGNVIPQDRISSQAKALLNLYPLPNLEGGARYNYQIPLVANTHQDSLQSRVNRTLNRSNQVYGSFAYQSTRTDSTNLFGFLDTGSTAGINTSANWRHAFTPRLYLTLGYQYSRLALRTTPFFEKRRNISGNAGITGNNQDPANWGPPALDFSSGISALGDAQHSFDRNQTSGVSVAMLWNHGRHNVAFGADFKRQQFNHLSQQDPRGTFTFTGTATGSDLAGFLLGIPDTSSIAFGNADKYFRASSYDAFVNDDWRISPGFTLNAGVRWEYGSPITELYGRLVNLDIVPGFSAVAPVLASAPTGPLTGQKYPDSLVQPDKHAFQPRVAISWRPFPASSMVVRAGYGVYYNTSVYQNIAMQMAQQSPLSKSLSVQNSLSNPLTLANGFITSASITPNTFAIDSNFRVGYSQNWQVSVQRDLPAAMVMTATYLGIKGTRGAQAFLPNTFPTGALNPCSTCPTGFEYLTSNGNSTRESGTFQLRRRLQAGFTATAQYTFSKSIDDAALGGRGQGGSVIAQDWLDLRAERALSTFDQRHLLNLQMQYSTGMGLGGGTLLSGWKGAAFKEWTVGTQITAGSGLPLTPIYLAAVHGTGVTGSIRPDYTGAPIYAAPPGLFLNPAAYIAPTPGHWGNAGRDSITGPGQFLLNGSIGRTFRVSDRMSLDFRIDATNALNHVVFPSWNTTVGSAQFGLPRTANAMRSLQTTVRLRF